MHACVSTTVQTARQLPGVNCVNGGSPASSDSLVDSRLRLEHARVRDTHYIQSF